MASKIKKITEEQILQMVQLRFYGKTNSEIAEIMKIHEGTVSRKINEFTKFMQNANVDKSSVVKPKQRKTENSKLVQQPQQESQSAICVPSANPFHMLDDFNEIGKYVSQGGAVLGAGLDSVYEGFTNKNLPYEERMKRAMKGFAVVGGSVLSIMETFDQLSQKYSPKTDEIEYVNEEEYSEVESEAETVDNY